MKRITQIVSFAIVLLGLVHIFCVFPLTELSPEVFWYIGAGLVICYSGLINLIALTGYGHKYTLLTAFLVNLLMCGLFIASLSAPTGLQVYAGIFLYFITSVGLLCQV